MLHFNQETDGTQLSVTVIINAVTSVLTDNIIINWILRTLHTEFWAENATYFSRNSLAIS
jgi:hypothetical protein